MSRLAIATISAALLLTACGGAGQAPGSSPAAAAKPAAAASQASTPVTIAVSSKTPGFLYVWVAQDLNMFQKHGLQASIAVMQPTAEVAALNSGELDFLANVPSAMQGAESGLPLKVVLVTSDFPNQLLIGAKDIKTPADLRGKVVAGSTPGSEPNQVTAALLEKYGLADGSYQFLSGGNSDDTRATMVANNNAKAALLGLAAAIRMLNDGYPLLDDATKFETVAEGLATSADKIAKQHDMVQRTIDATLEAMQVMRTDQQSILPILQKEFGFSAADAEKAFGLLANRWTPDGRPTATAIQTQFDLDVKDQHLAQRPKESDLFDFSLLHASSS